MSLSDASFAARALHADAYLSGPEVAASISTSTTFRHPAPEAIEAIDKDWDAREPSRDIYSRESQPIITRVEHVLEALIGQPTLIYPSGVAAFYAALLLVRPDVLAAGQYYGGCRAAFEIYQQTRGADQVSLIGLDDEYPKDKKLLVWVETPLNPHGSSLSIEHYAQKAHAVGGLIGIDSTFAPPPLSDPFKWGADLVMHSGAKYFAGHSDLLAGTLSVRSKEDWHKLWNLRTFTGTIIGSLDSWLLLRSLRTLSLRVERQAKTATALATWLNTLVGQGFVEKVWHTCLQEDAAALFGEGKQVQAGPACFSVLLKSKEMATYFPGHLKLFVHATSLGGVESLIEHRIISDPKEDPRLVRLSIGLEDFADLQRDLEQGMAALGETRQ